MSLPRNRPSEQFLRQVGGLLTKRIVTQQETKEQKAAIEFGSYLTAARTSRGLSRAALAQQVGVADTAIYALEHGLCDTIQHNHQFLNQLAVALDDDVDLFYMMLRVPVPVVQQQSIKDRYPTHSNPAYIKIVIYLRSKPNSIANFTIDTLSMLVQYHRLRNLLDRCQASRLRESMPQLLTRRMTGPHMMPASLLMTALLCFVITWGGIGSEATASFFLNSYFPDRYVVGTSVSQLQTQRTNREVEGVAFDDSLPRQTKSLSEIDVHAMNYALPQLNQANVRMAKQVTGYRIVYQENATAQDLLTSLAIAVDEQRMAIIQPQLNIPPSIEWRCQNARKLDICPI